MKGTLLNVATVLMGGSLGTVLGNRMPQRLRDTVMDAIGLFTVFLGLRMALQTENPLIVLVSLLGGAVIGEALRLEERIEKGADRWQHRLAARLGSEKTGGLARGLVTASLVFCAGPMTVVGSIQDGLYGDYSTLAVKATLDGITSMAFASVLGIGVTLAAGVVLIVQGSLSLAASLLRPLMAPAVVHEIAAVGGLLILAIGANLLGLKQIRTANLLPAMILAPLLAALAGRL